MKIRNIICIVLCFVMTLTVLSACASNVSTVPTGIDADGRFIYTIIRGENSGSGAENAAKALRTAFKENFGAKASIAKDNVVENVEGVCEILVGETNRPESLQTKETLLNNRTNTAYDFIVKVINNKICIMATTDEMVKTATDWFISNFCQSADSWGMLRSDYEFIYAKEYESVYNTVAGTDIGLFTFVKPREFSYLIGMEIEDVIKFYKTMGFEMKYVEDMDEETPFEILVGDTTREESKSVTVEGDNYVIKVVGTKLVIKGGNELSTYRAAKHFADLVKNSKKDGFFNWTDGYVINGKYEKEEKDVYTLNFFDEFEGSRVNTDIWGDYTGEATRSSVSQLGGKRYEVDPMNESGAYTKDTGKPIPQKLVYQKDGSIALGSMYLGEKNFIGANLSTWSSMNYRYGFLEIRSQFAASPSCTAFWLVNSGTTYLQSRYGDMSSSGFTELDLVENYGHNDSFGANVHRWWTDYSSDLQSTISGHNGIGGDSRYAVPGNDQHFAYDTERYGDDLTTSFNTYSFYWDDKCYKFAFNGKTFLDYQFKDNLSIAVHELPMLIIISNCLGISGYGLSYSVGNSPEYTETYLDWVRVYQSTEFNSQMMIGDGQWAENPSYDNTKILYPEHSLKGTY